MTGYERTITAYDDNADQLMVRYHALSMSPSSMPSCISPQLQGHGFEIVRYRDDRGRFDEVPQLEEVPGLAGKWNGAEQHVAVG